MISTLVMIGFAVLIFWMMREVGARPKFTIQELGEISKKMCIPGRPPKDLSWESIWKSPIDIKLLQKSWSSEITPTHCHCCSSLVKVNRIGRGRRIIEVYSCRKGGCWGLSLLNLKRP